MTVDTRHPIDTLMLIDDSEIDQMIYHRIVSKSGLVRSLLQYFDGNEALADLSNPDTPNPDLILLDINMPLMDGFEFLDAATKKLGAELCPIVVMLTTSLNPRDEQRAKSYSVVRDFLNKPLTKLQLEALSDMIDAEVTQATGPE